MLSQITSSKKSTRKGDDKSQRVFGCLLVGFQVDGFALNQKKNNEIQLGKLSTQNPGNIYIPIFFRQI